MKLAEIKPIPHSSVLHRNWKADAPCWIIGGIIGLPAVFIDSWGRWLFVVLAVVAAMATDFGLSRLRQKWRVQDALTPPPTFPPPPTIDVADRAAKWDELFDGTPVRSIVMFSYGTCVVSIDEVDNPEQDAKTVLKTYGHSIPGTPSAYMLIYPLGESGDFVIGYHHPNILTFVSREEFPSDSPLESRQTSAAYLGRIFRVLDTFSLDVIDSKLL